MSEERKNEIIREYESLNELSRNLTHEQNDIWVKREKLRADYKTLTGKDIGTHFEPK